MRILVTGAGGFLGRRVLESLAQLDVEVHASARHAADNSHVRWHAADLLDPDQRRRLIQAIDPSHLVHLAWTTEHGAFWESPENRDWVLATIDLLEHFADAGGTRAVLIGSCAEYDWSDPALAAGRCREFATPLAPISEYARAKLATFHKASELAVRMGIDVAWARLFFLYGIEEDESRLVPSLIRSAFSGEAPELHHPNRVLDFIDTADAADALVAVLRSDLTGPVNVASGCGVRLFDLAQAIARVAGTHSARTEAPPHEGEEAHLRLVADTSRLLTGTQFDPKYDLEASLTPIVAWWRSKQDSNPNTSNR